MADDRLESPQEARSAIEALVYGYAERLDAGDFAGVGALFREGGYGPEDGELTRGSEAVARLLEGFIQVGADGTPGTMHLVTNLVIEIDAAGGRAGRGDRATARSCFAVHQRDPDASPPGAPRLLALGRYRDAFVRDVAGWRFDERRIRMEQVGDLSRHLRRGIAP